VTAPAGLILAAGEGRRLGQPKALVVLGGELLVDRAIRVARDAGCAPIVVVLGAAADEVVHTASLDGAVVVVNDGWPQGIGSSLCCGLSALSDQHAPAAVVLLVDQPDVGAETVRRVIETWRSGNAAAVTASYDGQPRNPVLLSSSTWSAVAATAVGDVGARAWLREHTSDVVAVACDDLGSDADIDTPADLERYVT
jgi:CTP:molybdopterin cytidylyltransferase MocA